MNKVQKVIHTPETVPSSKLKVFITMLTTNTRTFALLNLISHRYICRVDCCLKTDWAKQIDLLDCITLKLQSQRQ